MINGVLAETQILHLIIVWLVLSLVILIYNLINEKKLSGLTLIFLANMSLIYLVGAVSYVMPNHSQGNEDIVLLGFRQAVLALGAFCFGNLFLAPGVLLSLGKGRQAVTAPMDSTALDKEAPEKLPFIYYILGFVFYFVLPPIVGEIATIKSFLYVGSDLLVVGVCLLCWKANREKNQFKVKFWLFSSFLFPILTVVQMGFLGFGTIMTLGVFVFVTRFLRPRIKVLIISALVIYLGLSFYQTYMRDRGLIRGVVWEESRKGTERIQVLLEAVKNPVFFNPFDSEQLDRINGRIDFNYISGIVVSNIASGGVELSRGQTLMRPIIAFIPRAFWPDKPATSGGSALASKYTGFILDDGNTTVLLGMVMEFYVNFATWGVIFAYLFLGIFYGVLDSMAGQYLIDNNYRKFIVWFLPGIVFVESNTLDGAVVGTFISLVLANVISKFTSGQYKITIILLAFLILLLFMMH